MTNLQTWTMTGLGTLALVVGVLLASGAITSAQSPTPTPSATEDTTDDGATPKPDASDDGTDSDGTGGHWCGGGANPLVFDAAGEILGLSQDELREAKRSGQTLAEIAAAQGMSAEDFKAALVANVTAQLQAQLDAGDITQEQFNDATANLNERLDEIINSEGGPRLHRHVFHIDGAAEALGISEEDLRTAIMDGQTLAEVAQAQGMSIEDFKAALLANITADLRAKLDAGEITQEQFDSIAADLSDKLDEVINAEGGLRFRGPGPGFGDGTRFRFAPPASDEANANTDA